MDIGPVFFKEICTSPVIAFGDMAIKDYVG